MMPVWLGMKDAQKVIWHYRLMIPMQLDAGSATLPKMLLGRVIMQKHMADQI